MTGGAAAPARLLRAARNLLAVALVVTAAAFAFLPPLRSSIERRVTPVVSDVRRLVFPHDSQVHPVRAAASGELPGHGAGMAIDGFGNTYWAADLSRGAQPTLTVTFDQPVDLYDFLFTSGVPDSFQSQARPRDLHVVFSNGTSWDVTLADENQPQRFTFVAKHVDRIDIQIRSTYPSGRGRGVALKKVEFFTRL
jgi:hypothetical protein